MRLHFFSATPLLHQKYIAIILLFLIIGCQAYWAIRNKSQTLSVISGLFVISAAMVTDSTHLMLLITIITASVSVYIITGSDGSLWFLYQYAFPISLFHVALR